MNPLHVLFRVGTSEYVLAAADVLHLDSYSGATKVPGAAPYMAGLVQIRGRVIPVVDMRARFGLPAAEPTMDARVVVVKSGERAVGLLVDSAREVVKLGPENFKTAPEVIGDDGHGFVKSVAQTGQRMVMLIDFHRVIGEEQAHGE